MRNMQGIVYENEALMRELLTHKRKLQQKLKEIDKHEAELELRSKQLDVLSEEVEGKLNIAQENFEREKAQVQSKVNDLCKKLEEKDYELDNLITLNNTLIAKECRSNHELQEARKVLIEGLDGFANIRSRPVIGIKRMGELNEKPFRDICIQKFQTSDWETKSAELCSLWQNNIQDSEWYPYKHVTIDNELHLTKFASGGIMHRTIRDWKIRKH
ncbi:hypothetical protein MKW94_005463 [Papaver nudicaule]|uniref:Factor of DNA methylation 1-5/IDN2 domain-containing protein n=1 Tax=Papaver nudicaule TaxID=74823 RepID=A0AA41VWI8_PAPNU|nr:hypothetical protein [Papaver nudicaule]